MDDKRDVDAYTAADDLGPFSSLHLVLYRSLLQKSIALNGLVIDYYISL